MPADGADQTTRTFWTRWRVDIRAPLMVRLLTYAPSAQRRPAGEKTTAAQGPPSNIAGSCFRVVFGDADATSCATFLIPMETACCHERTSLQHGRGLVPPERTMSSRVAPAVNSACQRFSK